MVKAILKTAPFLLGIIIFSNLTSCVVCNHPPVDSRHQNFTKPIFKNKTSHQDHFDFEEPQSKNISKKLKLWATYYRIHTAKHYKKGIALKGQNNNSLGPRLSEKDWCEAALEGTVLVKDFSKTQKVYNYLDHKAPTQANCKKFYGKYLKANVIRAMNKTRFVESTSAYGYGIKNWHLNRYRTIAVDHNVIPYGSVIYIPKARGKIVTLKTGEVFIHDGYFYAADKGGAIKNNHIDVFAGYSLKNPFPEFIKNSSQKTFEAYLIKNAYIQSVFEKLHKVKEF